MSQPFVEWSDHHSDCALGGHLAPCRDRGGRELPGPAPVGRDESRQPSAGDTRAFLLFVAARLNLRLPADVELSITVGRDKIGVFLSGRPEQLAVAERIAAGLDRVRRLDQMPEHPGVHDWHGWFQGAAVEVTAVTA
jgi:hypothetical protein